MASREARKSRGLFRGFVNWVLSYFDEKVPSEHVLEGTFNTMVDALEAEADAASMAMALADQTRRNLKNALAEHDEYVTEAVQYARDGNEPDAKRCLLLKGEVEARIESLTETLREQQANADHLASQYAGRKAEVDRRRRELPQLKADVRVAEAETKFAEAEGRYNVEAAASEFDQIRDEVDLIRQQARNRVTLNRDPVAETRAKVRDAAAERRLQKELELLMDRVQSSAGANGEDKPSPDAPLQIEHNPAQDARELLAQPRLKAFAKKKMLEGQ